MQYISMYQDVFVHTVGFFRQTAQEQCLIICKLHQGRLGAVACLQLAVKHFNIEDHVLVVGG